METLHHQNDMFVTTLNKETKHFHNNMNLLKNKSLQKQKTQL